MVCSVVALIACVFACFLARLLDCVVACSLACLLACLLACCLTSLFICLLALPIFHQDNHDLGLGEFLDWHVAEPAVVPEAEESIYQPDLSNDKWDPADVAPTDGFDMLSENGSAQEAQDWKTQGSALATPECIGCDSDSGVSVVEAVESQDRQDTLEYTHRGLDKGNVMMGGAGWCV